MRGALRPRVRIHRADRAGIVIENDQEVVTRDGTVLRVNVYRPATDVPVPVILVAHPYGKDDLPTFRSSGRARVGFRYRIMRQPDPVTISDLTTWEAPDPAWWTAQGYAVVNGDLRGAGTSDGTGALMSAQEAGDVHDLVEWAAGQPWSTGSVGMLGVSYLAISQWAAAAQRPPSLKAIAPWEGFTDAYRGLIRPGGVREVGFLALWALGTRNTRQRYSLKHEARTRPTVDDFWRSLNPDLTRIDVPALICGSFSDNNLHSRGSFAGFEGIASTEKHLHTHRGGKWSEFYSEEGRRTQLQFFDRHLRGKDVPALPAVRLEVRDRGDHVVEVRDENEWPLARTRWTPAYLTDAGLRAHPASEPGSISFDIRRGGAQLGWTVPDDVELTGPMALRLHLSLEGADDMDLVVGVEKWSRGRFVGFEGSYGYGRDRVATGWQNVAMRELDPIESRPGVPVPACTSRTRVRPGETVVVDVALGASSTLFRAGDQVRLVVAGRWLSPRNPLTGQFPAAYATSRAGTCTLRWGPDQRSHLLLPVIPATASG